MTDLVPLPIYPWPLSESDREILVEVKGGLGLDFLVKPTPAFGREAGGWIRMTSNRVLCLREEPPGLCDHAMVRDPSNKDALHAALWWVLTDADDSRATTIDVQLSKLIPGIREVSKDEIRYKNLSKNLGLSDLGKVPIFREEFDD